LQKAKEGHIVNLSSMFGLFAMPGQAMYSASKAGIRAFTEALWTELAGSSIRLTTVHPGTIRSNVIRSARMPDPEAKARAVEMQERYGMPTDKAAEKIIRAIEKNKLRVLVGIDAYIGEFLKRLFPVGLQRMLTLAFRLGGVETNG
ncbi:MAG: SDR family NAD(P)-dependent oxidoreductase, partial [bacterium]|nr:SDR family NAD(P)-dependent oxidoreductase [bacterium]